MDAKMIAAVATSSSSLLSGGMATLQVQDASDSDVTRDEYSACFPLNLFGCCPTPVRAMMPSTWTKIQDWTHLSLIFGVFASVAVVAETVIQISGLKFDSVIGTAKELIFLVFIAPVCCYFITIIGQYDSRLRNKQKNCKEQKQQLTKAYNNLLSDMDGLLTKSAESSAGLAERSFESKRRDFQRFLERAKSKYSEYCAHKNFDSKALLVNFRGFVLNWLKVFEECSIDPMNSPKRILKEEELNACNDIGEICDLVLPRLRCTEVRFITLQREQDSQLIKKNRHEFRRMTASADPKMLAALESGSSSSFSRREITTELSTGGRGCRLSWLSCGCFGVGCNSSQSEDGFPKECRCGCFRLVRLSREHTRLLVGFMWGLVIFGFECFHGLFDETVEHRFRFLVEVGIVQICIVILLARFEEIDIVQQLEREIKDLKKAEQNVTEQRTKMHDFWTSAQQLTELWLHRTVPRLDLYKEVHSLLEDADEMNLNAYMEKGNLCLKALDSKLGELKAWRNEGSLSTETKKNFGKKINALCQEQNFNSITMGLDQVVKNDMKALESTASRY